MSCTVTGWFLLSCKQKVRGQRKFSLTEDFVSWHARWNNSQILRVYLSCFWKTTHKLRLEGSSPREEAVEGDLTFVTVTYKTGQSDFFATSGANWFNASFRRLLAFVTTKLRPQVPLPLSTKYSKCTCKD